MKPFSQACENNKQPILAQLQRYLTGPSRVLEIGSGTGQHAVYFAAKLPQVQWQTSDLAANHAGINAWLQAAKLANARPPVTLDVRQQPWPVAASPVIYTANTLHIMPWAAVVSLFAALPAALAANGLLFIYGPFMFSGEFTAESNRRFDAHLRQRDPDQGLREFEHITALAEAANLVFVEEVALPANNHLLVFKKIG